ncbi:PEP-CTERM sorting domain-containing protein [bacterium]|nr:MAG: PEP-CTERM sorting domain-containing protein [bacterium]
MLRSFLTLSAVASVTAAYAVPVNITLTGTGSGSLNGTTFSNKSFTITGVGYTEDAVKNGSATILGLTSFGFSVSGVDEGYFNDAGRFFFTTGGVAGFGAYFGTDFIDTHVGSSIASYDFAADYGPKAGSLLYLDITGRNTSAGVFNMHTAGVSSLSIDVQSVPEPASMAALGLGGLALLRMRRRSA